MILRTSLVMSLLTLLTLAESRVIKDELKPLHRPCCFGSAKVKHGKPALTLPRCCFQLICNDGKFEKRYIGKPGNTSCCELDGVLYPEGYEMPTCLPLVCENGEWHFLERVRDCCSMCTVYNDPHLVTFDNHTYDWHGACNYTITQNDFTYTPDVAVYSDFGRCWGCASCLTTTTFRNDPHTIITLYADSVFDFMVNGSPYTVPESGIHSVWSSDGPRPVLAWRRRNCVILVGSTWLVLHHCHHRLDIWAHPSHTGSLDGLCGHFNFYLHDDFTDRFSIVHKLDAYPREFPLTWKTKDQTNQDCNHHEITAGCPAIGNPCRADSAQMDEYTARCKTVLLPVVRNNPDLHHHIGSCAFDLCMMYRSGVTDVDSWLQTLVTTVEDTAHLLLGRDAFEDVIIPARLASSTVTVLTTILHKEVVTSMVTSLTDGFSTVLVFYDYGDAAVISTPTMDFFPSYDYDYSLVTSTSNTLAYYDDSTVVSPLAHSSYDYDDSSVQPNTVLSLR